MNQSKTVIFCFFIIVFLSLYTLSLRNNIKLQKEINISLETKINAINERNEYLYKDFQENQKQKEYYYNRYNTLQQNLKKLSQKKGNECLNEQVSDDLIKLLKNS